MESQSFSTFPITEVSVAARQLLQLFSALLSVLKIFKIREAGIEWAILIPFSPVLLTEVKSLFFHALSHLPNDCASFVWHLHQVESWRDHILKMEFHILAGMELTCFMPAGSQWVVVGLLVWAPPTAIIDNTFCDEKKWKPLLWNAIDTQLLTVWNLKRLSQTEVSTTLCW